MTSGDSPEAGHIEAILEGQHASAVPEHQRCQEDKEEEEGDKEEGKRKRRTNNDDDNDNDSEQTKLSFTFANFKTCEHWGDTINILARQGGPR